MQVNKRDAARVFRKLKVREKTSTHHVAGVIELDGVLMLPIYYSRGRGDMPGRVGESFRKSLYVTQPEFARLIGCTMSREEWAGLVSSRIRR